MPGALHLSFSVRRGDTAGPAVHCAEVQLVTGAAPAKAADPEILVRILRVLYADYVSQKFSTLKIKQLLKINQLTSW